LIEAWHLEPAQKPPLSTLRKLVPAFVSQEQLSAYAARDLLMAKKQERRSQVRDNFGRVLATLESQAASHFLQPLKEPHISIEYMLLKVNPLGSVRAAYDLLGKRYI